jgi:hypothetical protein
MGKGIANWNNIFNQLPLGPYRELGIRIESIFSRFYRRDDYNNPFYTPNFKEILYDLSLELNRIRGGNYNLFPSEGEGDCSPLAIGIAELDFETKSKKGQFGFRGLLGRMTAYWFNCSANQYNILFTNSFNRDKFKLAYEPMFKQFDKMNRGVVVIEVTEDDAYIVYRNEASFSQLL